MVVSSVVNSGSFNVSTPSDQEICLTRLFDAPRQLVFDAMTKCEHVRRWWGCIGDGCSVPVCEIDLRPGGRWKFVHRHPTGDMTFYGQYREIEPPHLLVFTEIFELFPDNVSVVTTDFFAEDGRTRMTATIRYPSLEVRDAVIRSGMASGAATSYDRLEEILGELQRA